MSNDKSAEKNDIEATTDAEFVMEDTASTVSDSPAAPAKNRNGIAWIAALFSLLALGIVGYQATQDWLTDDADSSADTTARLDAADRGIRESKNSIAALESRIDQVGDVDVPDYSAAIAAARQDVEEQLRRYDSLPARLSVLENSVASLAGISTGARETFLLAEAEYYLQIANAQLQLANNPQLATLALGMADERVRQMSDPGLTDVRRAISDELAALEVMKKPDLEGATLTLASLARVVESLPLASTSSEESTAAETDEEQGNIERAWSSVKGAMSGLVKVTPPDQAKLALVSPDAEYFLRNNIALQLQSARLALLRGEQAIFEQSLDDTRSLLNDYFDTNSEQVSGALQTIMEIREGVFTASPPDISASLRLLRQFRVLRETTE